jgi:hypothetical protein
MARVPNGKKKRLNRCKSSRVIASVSLITGRRGEKCCLRGFREFAGAVCFVTFAGNAVCILPDFLN